MEAHGVSCEMAASIPNRILHRRTPSNGKNSEIYPQ